MKLFGEDYYFDQCVLKIRKKDEIFEAQYGFMVDYINELNLYDKYLIIEFEYGLPNYQGIHIPQYLFDSNIVLTIEEAKEKMPQLFI